ncbi:endonuclease/exonuclease/phosphatase family protein [Malaciobacter mytili]|uniref:endonuclease/exonuclease/phosphatase family protein n=1 Tax=Malaciobacter mytili TaxID=603050 RepID=UPI003A84BAB6
MKKYLLLFIFFTTLLFSKEFSVTSYNVENFFDLNYDKTEYEEYIPNSKSNWNKSTYNKKIENIAKVLKELDSSIIALQEIESKLILKDLQRKLPKYKYITFVKYPNSSVGLGFLSKIKILHNNQIKVRFQDKTFRPILETTFIFDKIKFKIFNNHWPSKKSKESYRIKYAYALLNAIKELPKDYDYIILGDFNSNYNEKETLKFDKLLNDSSAITGINDILNTTIKKEFINKSSILEQKQRAHYNLWFELKYQDRFSYKFKGQNSTPDNIILPISMFDKKNISYINNSFKVFKPPYLYDNKKINRWQIKNGIHKKVGFSDHLPISASFKISNFEKIEQNYSKISDLYKTSQLEQEFDLKQAVVIYKNKDSAIIKQEDNRAIFIYKAPYLKLAYSYDLRVKSINEFFGLKQIENFSRIKVNKKIKELNPYYLKVEDINNFEDLKYQNEVLVNFEALYKDKKLEFNNQKIKVYFKNHIPKDNKRIFVKKAHIAYFKQYVQLIIYSKEDFEIIN